MVAIQWVSGPLFVIGLLGILRRHSEFLDAPGVSIGTLHATPLGYLLLFILGMVGISALRAERFGARYLPGVAVVLVVLAAVGGLVGGADADGLAFNDHMIILLLVLAAAAGAVAVVERRKRPSLS
jgi:nitrate reductase gamma subunit